MKRITGEIILILIFAVPALSQKADTVKYQVLEPYDFHTKYLKEDPASLVDVREGFEFRSRRIKDAENIPSSGNLDFAADTIDKKCALFFYCTSGFRSNRVAKFFAEKGFAKVYSLKGGITEWKKDGFPVVKKKLKNK